MTRRPLPRRSRALAAAALSLALLAGPLAPSSVRATEATGARAEIERLLRRAADAIAARDTATVLSLYELPDSSDMARKRLELEGTLGLDSLAVEQRLGRLEESGDRAAAAVFQRTTYRENGRVQVDARWSTLGLRREAAGWRIVAEDPRGYLRTRFTDLAVHIRPDSGDMSGAVTLRLSAVLPGEDGVVLALNRGLTLTSLEDGAGRGLPFTRLADAVLVTLPATLRTGDSLLLRVGFAGRLFNENRENGYSQVSIAPEGSFASWVTAWYPHVQGPGGRSRGRIAITVPRGLVVVASGHATGTASAGPDARHDFAADAPVDFTFAVARYAHRERTVGGVNAGVYFLSGSERKADLYIAGTARVLGFLRDYYGMYPYDGFALVEIPRSGALGLGGSSEQGMSLFTEGGLPDSIFPLPLVAHEMGHSWWGNYVASEGALTSEGLAQLSAALAVRALEGEPAMRRFLAYGRPEYPQSAMLYFHDFAPFPEKDLPVGIERPGSANVALLHDLADTRGHFAFDMLRAAIGETAFQRGLRGTIADFAGRPLRVPDLEREWEKASGRKLDRFFAQWFDRGGAPEFVLRDSVTLEGGRHVVQGTITQLREIYEVPLEVVAVLPGAKQVETVAVSGRVTPFAFTVPAEPRAVLLDPDYRVLRWTGDFKAMRAIVECRALRSLGRRSEAMARLDSCLVAEPDADACRVELGICQEKAGRRDEAERTFRSVVERDRLYPAFSPAVPASLLHLGELCDVEGRRDEALRWYRQVLEMPDAAGEHERARALVTAPYAPLVPPSPEALRRYEGTFVLAGIREYVLRVNENGILTISGPELPEAGLEWTGGMRFDVPTHSGVSLEFAEGKDGSVDRATIRMGSMEAPFLRKTP